MGTTSPTERHPGAMTPDWTLVIDGVDFGEGPRWRDGRLWFSDFFQHTISSIEVHPDGSGTRHVEIEYDGRPSGLGWLPDGRLLFVSMTDQRVMRREADGTIVVHADLAEATGGFCNDMVVSADGTAYVGNFGFDFEAGDEPASTRLVIVSPDGAVRVDDRDLMFPNGSVITPDERTLIVGESFGAQYTAFTIADDGSLTDARVWVAVSGTAPDGCTLDAEGAIWYSDAVGSQVVRVVEGADGLDDPRTTRLTTPDSTFACMLGGDDGRTLFVLCSAGSHPDQVSGTSTGKIWSTRVEHPHAGRP